MNVYQNAASNMFKEDPALQPLVPVEALPYAACVLLGAAFLLGFAFTTLPRKQFTVQEPLLALASSLCAGFGTVALFNAVGVYV